MTLLTIGWTAGVGMWAIRCDPTYDQRSKRKSRANNAARRFMGNLEFPRDFVRWGRDGSAIANGHIRKMFQATNARQFACAPNPERACWRAPNVVAVLSGHNETTNKAPAAGRLS
jgi:hypothetical protein